MEKRIFALNVALMAAAIGMAIVALGVPPSFAADNGHGFSGNSAAHLSAQGISNSNGPNALDRDKGLQRAEDRSSEQGLEHGKHGAKAHGHAKKHGHDHHHGHDHSHDHDHGR